MSVYYSLEAVVAALRAGDLARGDEVLVPADLLAADRAAPDDERCESALRAAGVALRETPAGARRITVVFADGAALPRRRLSTPHGVPIIARP